MGRLQSLNTSFMAITQGCPSLECQVGRETALLETVFTKEALLDLFTKSETEFEQMTLGTGSETPG